MDPTSPLTIITALGACRDAREWAADYPDLQTAWNACARGDWLAWWLGRLGKGAGDGSAAHRRAVLVACLCARTLPSLSEEDERHLTLLEIWALGGEDGRTGAENTSLHSAVFAACNVAVHVKLCGSYASYCAYNCLHGGLERKEHLTLLADLVRPCFGPKGAA